MNALRTLALLALAALLAAACATLRVDVDVYTGPLADHEDIQAERMAVMAIGAKPLLVELRDRLENLGRDEAWKDPAKRPPGLKGQAFAPHIGPGWQDYVAGFIRVSEDPAAALNWTTLIDPKAKRTNAVLGLYEDKINAEIIQYIKEAELDYSTILRCKKLLYDGEAEQWYASLKPGFMKNLKNPDKKYYIDAYEKYFSKMIWPYDILDKPQSETARPGRSLEWQTAYIDVLRDSEKIVKIHADILFDAADAAGKEAFIAMVRQRADTFMELRQATDHLFTLNLMFLRDINQDPNRFNIQDKPKLNAAIAGVVCRILRTNSLSKVKGQCRGRASDDCTAIHDLLHLMDTAAQPDLRGAIYRALVNDPVATATQLLDLHARVKDGAFPEIANALRAVQFGITLYLIRGDWDTDDSEGSYATLLGLGQDLTSLKTQTSCSGLERGRSDWGLQTLIENYLARMEKFQAECGGCAPECGQGDAACRQARADLDEKRSRLHTELVRFAEKVLVIANQEILLSQYADAGGADPKVDNNVQVLQAVANSILTQANELRYRQEHRDMLAKRLPGLQNALAESYLSNGGRTLALISEQLAADLTAAQESVTASEDRAKAKETEMTAAQTEQSEKTATAAELEAKAKAYDPAKPFRDALAQCLAKGKDLRLHTDAVRLNLKRFTTYTADTNKATVKDMLVYLGQVTKAGNALDSAAGEATRLNTALADIQEQAKAMALAALPAGEPDEARNAFNDMKQKAEELQGFVVSDLPSKLDAVIAAYKAAAACLNTCQEGEDTCLQGQACATWTTPEKLAEAFASLANDTLLTDLDTLQTKAAASLAAVKNDWKAIEKRVADLTKDKATAATAAAQAKAKADKAKSQMDAAASAKTKATEEQPKLETAITTVKDMAASWQGKPSDSPKDILQRLKDLLKEKADQSDAAAATTLEVLNARTFAFPVMGALTPKAEECDDPRLALDQLLDSLRLLHSQSVRAGGADSAPARRLAESIEVVEAHRAGLVFLRPASSILRSSYPATSLQMREDLKWKNTLVRNFFRSFPGSELFTPESNKRRMEVFNEIDRQSWQTVNTVRLEGVGNTNYAIAKDDIGNWYAKAYATDPTPIIKAAKGLAMFSMGLGAPGVAAVEDGKDTKADSTKQEQTALERLHDKHATRYANRSKEQATALADWLKSAELSTRVSRAWEADGATKPFLPDLTAAWKAAAGQVDLAAEAAKLPKDEAGADYGGFIRSGLKAVKRLAAAVHASIATQSVGDESKQAYYAAKDLGETVTDREQQAVNAFKTNRSRAQAAARSAIRAEIESRLDQRLQVVEEYYNAAAFIGEATGTGSSDK